MADHASILEQINQLIDGHALAVLLNYHPDKIQIGAGTVKLFCPAHQERAFRSLIINLKANTYKCMMKHCPCFKGGTLVELWAIHRQMEPLEAALDLAEKLKLPVDVETLRKLGENYAEKARQALAGGKMAEARAAIEEAITMDSRNLDLRKLSADIWQAAGQLDRALQDRIALFDGLLVQDGLEAARELLDAMIECHGFIGPVVERRVTLARRSGEDQDLVQGLLGLADLHMAQRQAAQSAEALEEASRIQTEDASLLERLAGLYESLGDRIRLADVLGRLAGLYRDLPDPDPLLGVLDRMARVTPEDFAIQEQMAKLLENAGRADQAHAQWLALLESHAQGQRFAEAREVLDHLLQTKPDDIELLERRARLMEREGDRNGAVAAWLEMAELARRMDWRAQVGRCFDAARALNPQDPQLRRQQAQWKLDAGDLEGGLQDLFQLAELHLKEGESQRGLETLDTITALAPTDVDRRLRIGRCLERNGLENEAVDHYKGLARDLLARGRHDAAQAICEEVRRLRPSDSDTLELQIEAHLAAGQKAEAIEVCRQAARELAGAQKIEQAEAALHRGIKIDRAATEAKTDLARLYENTGRGASGRQSLDRDGPYPEGPRRARGGQQLHPGSPAPGSQSRRSAHDAGRGARSRRGAGSGCRPVASAGP